MRRRKKKFSGIILLIISIVIMQLPVSKADAQTSASDFLIKSGTLVKYQGSSKNVTIPNTVDTIGKSAFENNSKVQQITVPKTVERIEAYAFWGCPNLTTVNLNSGLTEISEFSFANCKGLTKMVVPSSVKYIGGDAFQDCVNLKEITIPAETIGIHETAFDGCYQLKIIVAEGTYAYKYAQDFYERQKEMPEYEDVNDYNTNPVPSNPVTNTPQETVSGSDSPTETTPQTPGQTPVNSESPGELLGSTTIVGNQAVVFIDNTKPTVVENGRNPNEEPGNFEEEVENHLQESGDLPKFTIVDGKTVADHAYYRKQDLSDVSIPVGITTIGQFAFARSSMASVSIPEGVEEIDYGAFYHCDDLQSVTLPSTLQKVEPKAFTYTAWMENFKRNPDQDFLISGDILMAYSGVGGAVVIPDGIRVIASEAFLDQTEVTSLTLPESLQYIGEAAFMGCRNLLSVSFGGQVVSIQDRAFYQCPLDPIELPASLQEEGLKAFEEDVEITYLGEPPKETYEETASRLSNESYRAYPNIDVNPGVSTEGMDHVRASVEGSNHSFLLSVQDLEDVNEFKWAYNRLFEEPYDGNVDGFTLTLTDESNIPITKLGKQSLTFTMDVPDAMKSHSIVVYLLDRNGQLENVPFERGMSDGKEQLRLRLTYVSNIFLCDQGNSISDQDTFVDFTEFNSMSEGPTGMELQANAVWLLKWCVGIMTMVTGLFLLFVKKHS